MSNIYKTDDAADKLIAVAMCITFMALAAVWILTAMAQADANVDCYRKGGKMTVVEVQMMCVTYWRPL